MKFDEMGKMDGKTLMLLPGTCCDYQTNFYNIIDRLSEKYHLICVNYDGFDGGNEIFPDMIAVTEKIEKYVVEKFNGRLNGALGSSLGSSFVGQLIQRRIVHIDHGIFGSPDIREFDMQHEQWLFGEEKYTAPVLEVIDEFMNIQV